MQSVSKVFQIIPLILLQNYVPQDLLHHYFVYIKHLFILGTLFQLYLIRQLTTQNAFKYIQEAVKDSRERRAYWHLGYSVTWALRALSYSPTGALTHFGVQGTLCSTFSLQKAHAFLERYIFLSFTMLYIHLQMAQELQYSS